MSNRAFIAPKEMLDKKPRHGAPCNRCGLCCVASICQLGSHVFGTSQGPCPALKIESGLSRCGLVDGTTGALKEAAKHLIGADTGCDARFNGELPDVGFYLSLERHDYLTRELTARSVELWGLK